MKQVHGRVARVRVSSLLLTAGIVVTTLVRTADAGSNSWTPLGPPGAGVFSIAAAPSDPNTIYISMTGNNLTMYGTNDGGATWHRLKTLNTFSPLQLTVSPTDPNTLFAFGPNTPSLHRSTDGGVSWSVVLPFSGPTASFAIDPTDSSILFAATQELGLQKSIDGGDTWSDAGNFPFPPNFEFTPIPQIVIDPSSPSRIYGLEDHDVFRSLDDGTTWTDIRGDLPASITPLLIALDPSDSETLYISAGADGIYKTTDGGSHWTGPAGGSAGMVLETLLVNRGDPSRLYAGTGEEGLLESIDSGATFSPSTNICSSTVGSITSDPLDSTHLTLGGTGGYFESTDSGDTWSRRTTGLPDADVVAVSVDPADPAHLFAAGYGSGLWESDNAGGDWNSLCAPSANTNVLSLAVDWTTSPPTLFAGTEDGVFRSATGGADWSSAALSGHAIGSIVVDPADGSHLIAGDNTGVHGNALFYSTDGGGLWNPAVASIPTGAAVCGIALDPSNSSTAYVAWLAVVGLSGGDVYKTTDGGAHWSATHVPNFPQSTSVAVDPQSPTNVYMTTDTYVYGSPDAGDTWNQLALGTGVVNVDPTDSDVLYLFSGILRKSTDGGATFRSISTPHSIEGLAFDPSTPDRIYAGMTFGGVEVLDQVPAELDSLSPTSGSTNGGTLVTLYGSGFTGFPTVLVDGIPVTPTAATATTITIVTPPHAAGSVDVTVINAIGPPVGLPGSYTYECGNPSFTAIVTGGGSYCATDSFSQVDIVAELSGVPPFVITWSDGFVQNTSSTFAERLVRPAVTTIYSITQVTDSSGCDPGAASGSATVTVHQPPSSPSITAPLFVPPFSPTAFTASVPSVDGVTYQWSSNTGSITEGWNTNQVTFQAYWPGSVAELEIAEGDSEFCYSERSIVHVPVDFLDVPTSNVFHDFVDAIAAHGVTYGCNGVGDFCPNASLDREHIAALLARAHDGGDVSVPISGTVNGVPYDCGWGDSSYFSDVPASDMFCRYVNRIAALGISIGCGPQKFCPHLLVTREQMALFIGRAIAPSATPPPSYTDGTTNRSYDCSVASPFPDVVANTDTCNAVGYIWAKGIVDGFGDGTFRPNDALTRAPAAKFIANAFGLALGP